MKMKSLILIFIALGCGLVASIGISQVMGRPGLGGGQMEMEQILVALTDIDIGAKLDAQNIKLEDWPKAKVPEGAVRKLEDAKDKYANARFYKGEPLHVNRISDSSGGSKAPLIPEGYRAIPVKVDEDTVMKAITPGDRVDVVVFLRKSDEVPETGAFTILRNVRVFAVNTSTERSSDSKGEQGNFRTVSLLVKPDHARELVVAGQVGKINLTLRRPDEVDGLEGEEVTPIAEILGGKAEVASEAPAPEQFPETFQGLLQGTQTAAPPIVAAKPAVFSLQVFGPTGVKQFDWESRDKLPTETTVMGGAPAPQPAVETAPAAEPTAVEPPPPSDEPTDAGQSSPPTTPKGRYK